MKPPLDECLCPICLEILIEPVTMPCQHELCMPCFQQNVKEANFFCPLCRLRISCWARTAANDHKLIDQSRWRQIRKFYPKEVASRMSGRSDYESFVMPPVHEIPRTLSEPGEIRREFEEEMRKFDEQLRLEHEQEETASRQFIDRLTTIEAAQMQVEESDEIIARNVQNLDSSQDVKQVIKVLRDGMDRRTKIYSQYEKLSSASPTEGDVNGSTVCPSAVVHDYHEKQYSPSNKPKKQKILYAKKDIAEFSRLVGENSRLPPTPSQNGFKAPRRSNSACLAKTTKNHFSPTVGRSPSCDIESPSKRMCYRKVRVGSDSQATTSRTAAADTEPDSITEELNHFFRPIEKSPITPPKRLLDGRPDLRPILQITPIKLPYIKLQKVCASTTDAGLAAGKVHFEQSSAIGGDRRSPTSKNKKSLSRAKSLPQTVRRNLQANNDDRPIAKRTRSATKKESVAQKKATISEEKVPVRKERGRKLSRKVKNVSPVRRYNLRR